MNADQENLHRGDAENSGKSGHRLTLMTLIRKEPELYRGSTRMIADQEANFTTTRGNPHHHKGHKGIKR
jgi:hypothetical protein